LRHNDASALPLHPDAVCEFPTITYRGAASFQKGLDDFARRTPTRIGGSLTGVTERSSTDRRPAVVGPLRNGHGGNLRREEALVARFRFI
jgi:hypothetical protein